MYIYAYADKLAAFCTASDKHHFVQQAAATSKPMILYHHMSISARLFSADIQKPQTKAVLLLKRHIG